MKKLLIIVALLAGGYQLYTRWSHSNASAARFEITNPVYAEFRVTASVANRELEMVLLGKMQDDEDCQERSNTVWQRTINDCAKCRMTTRNCPTQLEPRYARLFDNEPTNATYIAFTPGAEDERNGRMIFWGVTVEESTLVCEALRKAMLKNYKGKIECILARQH